MFKVGGINAKDNQLYARFRPKAHRLGCSQIQINEYEGKTLPSGSPYDRLMMRGSVERRNKQQINGKFALKRKYPQKINIFLVQRNEYSI
ncbi:MAG: hypothetical protein H6563_05410 [Lewinellaceae bacterium]|nr:hypothetical protein [Lewinellaceae bacterium]